MSYNSSTNRLTSIGSTTVSNDAAGNQLNDIWSTYEYDAEGRVTHSSSTGQWQYPTYNALGQRVEDYQSAGSSDSMKLYYPRDIFGQRTGIWDDHSSLGWVGWDVYFSQIAGQRLNMGGADAYIDHADAVGSTTMDTDPAGAVQWDVTHYPWGGVFQEQGARQSEFVMGLDWQINDPVIPSATRELSSALGRWLTPDPMGGDVTNPQSLNRYAYVLNNPATLTDPLGLCPKGDYPADMTGPCRPGLGWSAGLGGGYGPYTDTGYCPPEYAGCGDPGDGGIGIGIGIGIGGGGAPPPPGPPPAGQPLLGGAAPGEINPGLYFPGAIPIAPGVYITPTGEIVSVWTVEPTSSAFAQWLAPAAAAATAFFSLKPQQDALNSGYYGCIGDEIFPGAGLLAAGFGKAGEELSLKALESNASSLAGAYYHFTDGRFTAWGASSKVIVPRAAGTIRYVAEWAGAGGWAYTDVELAWAIHGCVGRLQ